MRSCCFPAAGRRLTGKYLSPQPCSRLAGSEWVTGSERRLLRIALDGVRGPIEVKGKRYQLEMPALRHVYGDEEMAAIRGQWRSLALPRSVLAGQRDFTFFFF